MSLQEELFKKRAEILKLAKANGVTRVRVFGSVARKQDDGNSDVDFLVDFEKDRSLFDLIRFKHELEDLLDKSVDVVTSEGLHWTLRENVEREAIML